MAPPHGPTSRTVGAQEQRQINKYIWRKMLWRDDEMTLYGPAHLEQRIERYQQ